MAIRSDNRPNENDVSFWLEEKSDTVLRDACALVDVFRKNKKNLTEGDLDKAGGFLFSLIYDAVKVVSFAHEKDQCGVVNGSICCFNKVLKDMQSSANV